MTVPDAKIYQYKISVKGSKPKIWRRVQVPENYTFWEMHVAIQDLMPCKDNYLHRFSVKDRNSGRTTSIGEINSLLGSLVNERDAKLKDYFAIPKDKGTYRYDVGKVYIQEIILESILPAIAGVKYPQCTAGKNLRFPEDGNGDPPETPFDCCQVTFRNPDEIWLKRFGFKPFSCV